MAKKKPKRTPPKRSSAKKIASKNQQKKSAKQTPKKEVVVKDLIPAPLIQKYGLYAMLGLVLLVILFVFRDFISQEYIYFFKDIGSDSYNVYLPDYYHNAFLLHKEGFPTWSFYQGMGQKVFPTGINSPFNFLMFLPGPESLVSGVFWMQLIKLLLGGFLCFQYAKVFDLNRLTAIFGGIIFTFVGYAVLGSTGWYGHVDNVVYGIFLLFSFEAFYQKKQWWFFPLAVFLVSASPVRLYLNGLFLFLYSLLRFLSEGKSPKDILIFYAKLAGLGALGVGLNAIFSVNTLLNIVDSPRVSGGFGKEESLSAKPVFALVEPVERITAIFRLFSNDMLGNGSDFKGYRNYLEAPVFYSGLFTLVLVPQLFQFLSKKEKIFHGVFIGLFILPVIFPYFRYAMFLFIGDYYKHGLSLFLPLTFIIYAIWALNHIIKERKINWIVLLGTLAFLLTLLYYPYFSGGAFNSSYRPLDTDLRTVVVMFLLLYTGGLLAFKFIKQKQIALLVLLGLVVVEAGYMANKTVNSREAITKAEYYSKAGYNDYAKDGAAHIKSIDDGFYRVNKDYKTTLTMHASLNDAKMQKFYGTPSYSSFNQLNYIRFLIEIGEINPENEFESRWANGLAFRPILHPFASIKYGLSKTANPEMVSTGFDPIQTFENVTVYQNKHFLPLGFSYDKYILYDDYTKLTEMQKEMMLYRAVVVDEPIPSMEAFNLANVPTYADNSYVNIRNAINTYARRFQDFRNKANSAANEAQKQNFLAEQQKSYDNYIAATNKKNRVLSERISERNRLITNLKANTLNITSHSQSKIEGDISLTQSKMLFFSIPFDSGWKAEVDGEDVTPLMTNVGFIGLPLEAGEHKISLRYRVPYLNLGLIVSLLSLLIYLGLLFFPKFKDRFFPEK